MSTDMTALLDEMERAATDVRMALEAFRDAQDEHSDVGNEGTIQDAFHALDDLDGHIGDLIP